MSSTHLKRLPAGMAMLLSWAAISAQPTIGTGDLPQGGEIYIRANAVPDVFSDIVEDGGENITWDFSNLIATGDLETEYLPMSAANVTTQFVFSSADHFTAFELPEIGLDNPLPISGATTYLQFGNSAYKVIGLGITTDIFDLPVIYEDDEELLPLPFVYGASLEGSSAFEVDLPDLLHYSTVQTSDIAVDAWGTLLLPGGSYECLRVKRAFSAMDSINVPAAEVGFSLPREGVVYEWYAPGEGMPILSIQSVIGIPAVWQFKPGNDPASVSGPIPTHSMAYPNPIRTGEDILINCAGKGRVSVIVFNGSGQAILDTEIDVVDGVLRIPSTGWSQGAYTASVDGKAPMRFILR